MRGFGCLAGGKARVRVLLLSMYGLATLIPDKKTTLLEMFKCLNQWNCFALQVISPRTACRSACLFVFTCTSLCVSALPPPAL